MVENCLLIAAGWPEYALYAAWFVLEVKLTKAESVLLIGAICWLVQLIEFEKFCLIFTLKLTLKYNIQNLLGVVPEKCFEQNKAGNDQTRKND